ncbi:Glycosyl transferases group 1 [Stieleria bergensis]|uniref:Glycosyl transferases group 1 n=1 Tax=Stieleria bergensis TaxID=2528025 RepID=A0A517SSS3_9BACT|nr:Glycosyl transferases group 1 [Planctomycetes bacterium SV_7m_r]
MGNQKKQRTQILVDATNLGRGGGTVLLKYLLKHLDRESVRVLISEKAASEFDACPSLHVESLNPLGSKRQRLLQEQCRSFQPRTLLCFGNVPPRQRVANAQVITYFHNAHLLASVDRGTSYSLKDRIRYQILRAAIRRRGNQSDYWVFQTKAICNAAISEHSILPKQTRVIPFYDDKELNAACSRNRQVVKQQAFTYVSNGRPHKNHSRLIQAWRILAERYDLHPELHLTVEADNRSLLGSIERATRAGVRVINHGELGYQKTLDLVAACKFVVYPSMLETLGLGMIEGAALGCDVLASDFTFVNDVIQASATFDATNPLAIVNVVRDAMNTKLARSDVRVSNQIQEMVQLLCS